MGKLSDPGANRLTLVFTDVEGSTRLLERLGSDYAAVLARHAQLLNQAAAATGGTVVDTQGDAFFLVFPAASAAADFARRAQLLLAAERWPRQVTVLVRMGIHSGEASPTPGGGYVGLDVHLAARVMAISHGGQVLLSEAAAQELRGMVLKALGTHHLKGFVQPVTIHQLLADGLRVDFPPPRIVEVEDQPPVPGEPPYLGLGHYEEADEARFFGREEVVDAIIARLAEQPFLAIVGASGSGKSSVVRAGLVPALRRRGVSPILLLTPTTAPLAALSRTLAAGSGVVSAGDLETQLRDSPAALTGFLPSGSLLVVDQLEELFSLTAREDDRTPFVDCLVRASEGPGRLVISLRADFYDRLAGYPRLSDLVSRRQQYLGPMRPAELRRAIEGPAGSAGWRLAPGLAELILHDAGGEPGALPLLSHALRETWLRRQGHRLTLRGYLGAGGVQAAIARSADRLMAEFNQDERRLARRILLRLTDVGSATPDTRRRAELPELLGLADSAAVRDVLDRLAARRLIVLDDDTAEIAHEALIREWPTLRGWLAEDRETLRLHRAVTEAALEWQHANRDSSLLFRGARLASATELEPAQELNRLEREFLAASSNVAEAEIAHQRRLNRRLRLLLVGAGGLLAIALASGLYALGQAERAEREAARAESEADLARQEAQRAESERIEADRQRELAQQRELEATEQRRLALSRQLAAQSNAALPDLDVALLLALEAGRVTDTVDARASLLGALATQPTLVTYVGGERDEVTDLAFSPDSRLLAWSTAGGVDTTDAGAGGLVGLWDLAEWRQPHEPMKVDGVRVNDIAFSWDGRYLAWGGYDATITVWDVEHWQPFLRPFSENIADVYGVTFSPDGTTLATAGGDYEIRLWDLQQRHPKFTLGDWEDLLYYETLAFSPDGRRLASVSQSGVIVIWDVAARARIGEPISDHRGAATSVAFSQDIESVALGAADGSVTVWSLAGQPRVRARLEGHDGAVTSVALTPDGSMVASGATSGTIRLWDLGIDAVPSEPLVARAAPVTALAFDATGQYLASGSADGTIALWNVGRGHRLAEVLDTVAGEPVATALAADGSLYAVSEGGGQVTVRDLERQATVYELQLQQAGAVAQLAFAHNGAALAVVSDVGEVLLARPHHGRWEQRALEGEWAPLTRVVISPDGGWLATDGLGGYIWDVATERQVGLAHPEWPVRALAFSPDSLRLAVAGYPWGGEATTIRIWDVARESWVGEALHAADAEVVGLAYDPTGRQLAAAASDGSVMIWNPQAGDRIGAWPGQVALQALSFSHDGSLLAGAAVDGTILLWNVADGQLLGRLQAEGQAAAIVFGPTHDQLLTAGRQALAWSVGLRTWQAEACRVAGRDLTSAEWARYLHNEPYRRTCSG